MRIISVKLLVILVMSMTVNNGCSQEKGETSPTKPVTLASLSEPCGELTAEAVLSLVEAKYSVALGLSKPTTADIQVSYKDGEIICHPARPAPPGSAAPDLPARIEVEVEVLFSTADSVFKETITAKLTGGTGPVNFSQRLNPELLHGSFDAGLPDYENIQVIFTATFSGKDTWGVVAISGNKPGRASELIPMGRWDSRH